ncbi:MAG: NADH-dependent phenylglyoxylate dehydrogenase subunit gamma [Firmicutes bacterium]|nr:NADH-dependent phenylglyoxylate dehydrogenase subunit gamma [Bacillota bacterium]
MTLGVIMAGFGGQGVMLMGQLLTYAGMLDGKQVSWMPSYGPEMRGGTANCTVIIADEEVGSPLVTSPDAVVALNLPSLDKFEGIVKPGGLLIYNSSLSNRPPTRTDIRIIAVEANDIATELGHPRVANMVALGALLEATSLVSATSLEQALRNILPVHRQELLPINLQAIARGRASVEPVLA